MAVAFVSKATTDSATGTPGSATITLSNLTIGAAATALVATTQVQVNSGTLITCTGMTWNGVTMTQLGFIANGLLGVYVFGLGSPTTGNHNLVASYAGASLSVASQYLDGACFSGTDTSTANAFPLANVLTDASSQTGTTYPTTAFSVTTVNGDAALASMQNQAVQFTGVAAGTLLRSDAPLNGQCTWGFHLATTASTTMQFTGGASGSASCGVAIRIAQPVAAGIISRINANLQAVKRASYY